jgi:hypothetical protein
MRRQVRQGESAGSAIRRCRATLSLKAGGVKGRRSRAVALLIQRVRHRLQHLPRWAIGHRSAAMMFMRSPVWRQNCG